MRVCWCCASCAKQILVNLNFFVHTVKLHTMLTVLYFDHNDGCIEPRLSLASLAGTIQLKGHYCPKTSHPSLPVVLSSVGAGAGARPGCSIC